MIKNKTLLLDITDKNHSIERFAYNAGGIVTKTNKKEKIGSELVVSKVSPHSDFSGIAHFVSHYHAHAKIAEMADGHRRMGNIPGSGPSHPKK